MTPWTVVYNALDAKQEGLREALCTLDDLNTYSADCMLRFTECRHRPYDMMQADKLAMTGDSVVG